MSKQPSHELRRKIALNLVQRLWNRIPQMHGNAIKKPMLERNYLMALAPWERDRWYSRRRKLMSLARKMYDSVVNPERIQEEESLLARDGTHIHLAA